MKVIHLSTGDGGGGAALAAYRLHQNVAHQGVESNMLVGIKSSDDPRVISVATSAKMDRYRRLDRILTRSFRSANPSLISPAFFGALRAQTILQQKAELTHLHWTCSGFLRIETLRQLPGPVVWSLHDMWAFSGGEHYGSDPQRYQEGYWPGNRPPGEAGFDLNRWIWRRKGRIIRALPSLTILCVSEWLAQCARSSRLLRNRDVRVLYNGVDLEIFQPGLPTDARRKWNLPDGKRLVLFGAVKATGDRRKGFDLLVTALRHLQKSGEELELVVFGNAPEESESLNRVGFPVHAVGEIQDAQRLASLYTACDVMVVPSREEAFGQTAAEAMASGIPVVAFRVGGLTEIISHETNGYLATPFDTEDLAAGIYWVLDRSVTGRAAALAQAARRAAAERFSSTRQGRTCAALYAELLSDPRAASLGGATPAKEESTEVYSVANDALRPDTLGRRMIRGAQTPFPNA